MEQNLEIRITVQIHSGVTVAEWEEYRDALISKLKSADAWERRHITYGFKMKVYETDGRKEVS